MKKEKMSLISTKVTDAIKTQENDIVNKLKNEAKPCPLCGESVLDIECRLFGCPSWTQIRCIKCNLVIGDVFHDKVLEKWNRRLCHKN